MHLQGIRSHFVYLCKHRKNIYVYDDIVYIYLFAILIFFGYWFGIQRIVFYPHLQSKYPVYYIYPNFFDKAKNKEQTTEGIRLVKACYNMHLFSSMCAFLVFCRIFYMWLVEKLSTMVNVLKFRTPMSLM